MAAVGENPQHTDAEHEQHQRRRADAHGHAAAIRAQAARLHELAGEFFAEHGQPSQAARERYLTMIETEKAAADQAQAAAAADS